MKKWLKRFLFAFIAILLVSTIGFLIYASDYYKADEVATNILQTSNNIRVQDNTIIIGYEDMTETDDAIIFYPGAKVEYTAYLPILEKIYNTTGTPCVLVKMPLNFAFFDANAADDIMQQFPDVTNWYMSGHSLGGAMASDYAANNQDKVVGLILMGAYIYGDYPTSNTLTIYGTLNTTVADKVNYTENVVAIEGGNHAQFGNYGDQKGDAQATITREEQQDIAVTAISEFLSKE